MSIRIGETDAHNLCNDYVARGKPSCTPCQGCRLFNELDKPAKERNKAFLKRIEPIVLKLRKQNKNKD